MSQLIVPLSLFSVASAFQIAETHPHVDYDGMKNSLLALAAKRTRDEPLDSETISAVNYFLDEIKKKLQPALEEDRRAAQEGLDQAKNAIVACDTARNEFTRNEAGFALADHNSGVAGKKTAHEQARSEESSSFTTYTGTCQTLKDRACGPGWSKDDCPIPDFSQGDTDAVNTYMNCLTTFFENNEDYVTERTNCDTSSRSHNGAVIRADAAQGEFENDFCTRENAIAGMCHDYESCRCLEEKNFHREEEEARGLEQIFQAQYVSLQHLICYGNQILNNSTDLSSCDDIPWADGETGDECDHYTRTHSYGGQHGEVDSAPCPKLNYPAIPDWIGCMEPHGTEPCATAFLNEFYADYMTSESRTPVEHDDGFTPAHACETHCNNAVLNGQWAGPTRKYPVADKDANCPPMGI